MVFGDGGDINIGMVSAGISARFGYVCEYIYGRTNLKSVAGVQPWE